MGRWGWKEKIYQIENHVKSLDLINEWGIQNGENNNLNCSGKKILLPLYKKAFWFFKDIKWLRWRSKS